MEWDPIKPISNPKGTCLICLCDNLSSPSSYTHPTCWHIWGNFSEDRALRNLSTTLWRIRQLIPDEYLSLEGDTIAFNLHSDYWLDCNAFEELCSSPEHPVDEHIAALQEAISLYRGDFLEGLYEDWALLETERLRSIYIKSLFDLMNCYQSQGEHLRALDVGQKLLHVDPLREDVYQAVMRLFALLGQRQAAMHQFQTCQRNLERELGIEPNPETLALYEQIRLLPDEEGVEVTRDYKGVAAVSAVRLRTPFEDFGRVPLVGRSAERNQLLSHIDRVRFQQGAILVIEGEPGIGKTRLAEEIASSAEWRGMHVYWGQCRDQPFAPLVEALRAALTPLRITQLGRMMDRSSLHILSVFVPQIGETLSLPPRSSDDLVDEKEYMFRSLLTCLLNLAEIAPYLLVIEDWQCMDAATLEFLPLLAANISDVGIVLLGTARASELRARDDVWSQVLELDRQSPFLCVTLECLSSDEARQLLESLLGRDGFRDDLHRKIYAQTQGNPLFIIETLKALIELERLVLDSDKVWSLADEQPIAFPAALHQVVLSRLNNLSDKDRQLLDMAAVLGDPFDYELLSNVIGWQHGETLFHSNNLLQRQLIVEISTGFRFAHDLIRQATYDQLTPEVRQQYHRKVGQVLVEFDPSRAGELARHFRLAGDDRRALPYCVQAGQHSEALYAHQAALNYYGWALESVQNIAGIEADELTFRASERRGIIYEVLGQCDQALESFRIMLSAAERMADPNRIARAIRRTAWTIGDCLGDRRRGLVEAQRALELATQTENYQLAAWIKRDMGAFHNMLGEYAQSMKVLYEALEIFREVNDLEGEAACLQFLAVDHHFLSQYSQSIKYYHQALELWKQLDKKRETAKTLNDIGYLCLSQGDFEEALDAFESAESIFHQIGAKGYLSWVMLGIGALHRYQFHGRLSLEALHKAESYEREAKHSSSYTRSLIYLHQGMAHWGLGEIGKAIESLEQSLLLARESEIPTSIVGALANYGRCLRQIGRIAQASLFFQEGLEIAHQVAFDDGIVKMQSELGLSQIVSGSSEDGMANLNDALQKSKHLSGWKIAETSVNLAEALLFIENFEEAVHYSRSGVELADSMDLSNSRLGGNQNSK